MDRNLMGVFAPISTPFKSTGEVDFKGLEKNVGAYASAGIKGFLALGSNGENKSLTNEEKLKVLEIVCKSKNTGQIVQAGCIFESTFETIDMAKKMQRYKPDYLTLLPPCYFKSQMTDDALYRYFTDVADAVDTPCLLYNAPQFSSGIVLSVKLLKRCAEHKGIVGVKDSSSGNMESILFALRDDFNVMSGTINNFFSCLTMGGTGGVLSLANSFPRLAVELYELLSEKKYAEAIVLNDRALQINKIVSGKGGVAAVKYAMDLAGFVGGEARLPLLPLSDADKAAIKGKLAAEGLIC